MSNPVDSSLLPLDDLGLDPSTVALFRQMAEPVLCCRADGRIHYVNSAAADAMGQTAEELVGAGLWRLFPEAALEPFHISFRLVVRGEPVELYFPALRRRCAINLYRLGDLICMIARVSGDDDLPQRQLPMTPAAARAFAAAGRDAQATAEILAQRQAVEAAELGTWNLDPLSGRLRMDTRGRALFGLGATAAVSYRRIIESLHPADAPRVEAAVRAALNGDYGGRLELTYRSIGIEDGTERWLAASGRCSIDAQGRPRRFAGVVSDVGRQHASQAARDRRVQELERKLRLGDLFAGMLGHDLRNPLSAIATSAELMRRRADSERIAVPAERIVEGAARMGRMIDQLLDFTRIRAGGGLPLHRQPVDLAELCRQVAAELAAGGQHGPIELTQSGDARGLWDRDQLWQLLANVIGNALRHGLDGSTVVVHADGDRDAEVILQVVNEGEVPEALLAGIFEPLHSAARRDRDGSSGLGLGLFISHQIALAHEGSIVMDSGASRQTRLTVRLPRRPYVGGPHDE